MRTVIQIVLGVTIALFGSLITGEALTAFSDANNWEPGLISASPVTALGLATLGGVVLATVIEERRVIQVRKTCKRREVELERLQDDFIRNVAHELRTPLAVVSGYLELLADDQLDEEMRRQAVAVAVDKIKELAKLVQVITTLHELKPDSLSQEPVDLMTVAWAAAEIVRQRAERAGITLLLDSPPELPLVTGDPLRLIGALEQLLDNAIKFSPDGGTIIVRLYSGGNGVRVEVTDQGIGIPAEDIDRIFDRFYQVDGSIARRFDGMGLGLAVVKAIVKAHQGQVWAESDGPGQGSTFILTLPHAAQRSVFARTGRLSQCLPAWASG